MATADPEATVASVRSGVIQTEKETEFETMYS
jgi:hypothetical protein